MYNNSNHHHLSLFRLLLHRCRCSSSESELLISRRQQRLHVSHFRRRLEFRSQSFNAATSPRGTKRPPSVTRKLVFPSALFFLLACGGGAYSLSNGQWTRTNQSSYYKNQRQQKQQQQVDLTIFHPFEIVAKQSVSSTCSIFTLKSQSRSRDASSNSYHELLRDAWANGVGVWSVQIKQPQLQIVRSYTPLPPFNRFHGEDEDSSSAELRFLIRHEPHGEVSSYLHNLSLGATVHVRGLDVEFEIPKNVDNILFLAGGTGIAPALQVAHCLLERRRKSITSTHTSDDFDSRFLVPKMHILWANRRREDAVGGVNSTCTGTRSNIKGFSSAAQEGRNPWNWSGRWTRFFWAAAEQQPAQSELVQEKQHETSLSSPPSSPPESSSSASTIITEINRMKRSAQGQITLDYFIDEEDTYITRDLLKTYLSSYHREKQQRQHQQQQQQQQLASQEQKQLQDQDQLPTSKRGLIMISGPDGFVAHHAGAKVWGPGGRQLQGPLGGILRNILDKGVFSSRWWWDVWKL